MAELTTYFCDTIDFAGLTLSQYGRYSNDRGAPLRPFLVEHTVLLYVTSGICPIKLNSTTLNIAPNMFVVLLPGVCADFSGMGTQRHSVMWMELYGEIAPTVLRRAGLTAQRPTLQHDPDSEAVALFTRLTDPENEISSLRANGLALELLDCLLTETIRPTSVRVKNLQKYYVDKAMRYISCKYPQDISVEDVADYCGLNRSYLGKLFRDAIGLTTQEYLISFRMHAACEYLAHSTASIATIARSVGYPNQLHFSRAFHKFFGIPPREWQKRSRNRK